MVPWVICGVPILMMVGYVILEARRDINNGRAVYWKKLKPGRLHTVLHVACTGNQRYAFVEAEDAFGKPFWVLLPYRETEELADKDIIILRIKNTFGGRCLEFCIQKSNEEHIIAVYETLW